MTFNFCQAVFNRRQALAIAIKGDNDSAKAVFKAPLTGVKMLQNLQMGSVNKRLIFFFFRPS